MKILIHDYAGHAFPTQLSRELALRGHLVVHGFAGGLLTPRGELCRRSNDPESLEFAEFPISENYRKYKYSFLKRYIYERQYSIPICNYIKTFKPDYVLSGNTPSVPQLKISQTCIHEGGKFISWVQDFYGIAVDRLLKRKLPIIGGLVGSYYKNLDTKCFKNSSGIIVITDDFTELVKEHGDFGDKIRTLPNWACLDDIKPVGKSNLWSVEHGLDNTFNFIYSGTLAMKHNPELILNLARKYKDNENVRVVVISEGPGADWLRVHSEGQELGNLVIKDFQPFKEMGNVLSSADVLMVILESDAGDFSVPSKTLTYLLANRPILAAMPEKNLAAQIIKNYDCGIVVDSTDNENFLQSADRLYLDSTMRDRFGVNGRNYAENNFEIGDIVDRFEGFLNSF